ncbi:MAG: helix-turn-helix transcriptional regulator, partial [Bacteroidota bacterium]
SAIGYSLLRRPDAVLPALVLRDDELLPVEPTPEAMGLADALRRHLEEARPYLDPEVRLGDLASHLGVTNRTASHVLTSGLGGSFYDVINGYRVEEAKARLADPAHAHLTVLAVGMDSGFSSKATFNRVFKKATGETPSAYRSRVARPLTEVGGDGSVRPVEVAS